MDNQGHITFESERAVDARQSYTVPKLVRLSLEETQSGLVILPIEILTVQGPYS